ncbi:hypothetical protein H4219_004746 [Mycoemilia scoparia]|uniref:Uncharacterized protein n=1 Tax=Mycoemilia scoparia TaxID=417184 RepID=A0A9W7ZQK1_9FUNG|nr:hypothetical protein H4219_004746 [Mycoemilia scoparia]
MDNHDPNMYGYKGRDKYQNQEWWTNNFVNHQPPPAQTAQSALTYPSFLEPPFSSSGSAGAYMNPFSNRGTLPAQSHNFPRLSESRRASMATGSEEASSSSFGASNPTLNTTFAGMDLDQLVHLDGSQSNVIPSGVWYPKNFPERAIEIDLSEVDSNYPPVLYSEAEIYQALSAFKLQSPTPTSGTPELTIESDISKYSPLELMKTWIFRERKKYEAVTDIYNQYDLRRTLKSNIQRVGSRLSTPYKEPLPAVGTSIKIFQWIETENEDIAVDLVAYFFRYYIAESALNHAIQTPQAVGTKSTKFSDLEVWLTGLQYFSGFIIQFAAQLAKTRNLDHVTTHELKTAIGNTAFLFFIARKYHRLDHIFSALYDDSSSEFSRYPNPRVFSKWLSICVSENQVCRCNLVNTGSDELLKQILPLVVPFIPKSL